jgi:hypothetical protein
MRLRVSYQDEARTRSGVGRVYVERSLSLAEIHAAPANYLGEILKEMALNLEVKIADREAPSQRPVSQWRRGPVMMDECVYMAPTEGVGCEDGA